MTASVLSVLDKGSLETASHYVTEGQAIVIPTETIFGLTCDAENRAGVETVYAIKGRSLQKQSAIFLPSPDVITDFGFVEHDYAKQIVHEFLPGPLTIVVKSRRKSWVGVVGDDGNIGIRISSEPFVNALSLATKKPLLATSANKSGSPDCLTLEALQQKLANTVPLILYRQHVAVEQPSTVVDLTGSRPRLLRSGAIDFEKIMNFIGAIDGN
jgi:L-threonylcarbamoyladenylate synthase